MNLTAQILTAQEDQKYEDFLLSCDHTLLYASVYYKRLIETHLKCKSVYTLALNDTRDIVGAFPLMIACNPRLGNVANSLPFFGSNGGMIVKEGLDPETATGIREFLLKEATALIAYEKCVASTFITNPFDSEGKEWLSANFSADFIDDRIGQITPLPLYGDNYDQTLMKIFDDPRPRNIRKALKEGVTVYSSNRTEDLDFLYKGHKENIEAIGGKTKDASFFNSIPEIIPGSMFKVWVAEKQGVKIAALLVFYFNKTVEYFTPCTLHEYRNLQPSSLLIFEAMKEAAQKGYCYWNWGGTWRTQDGVYDFKKKWGATDHPYFYFTKIYDPDILKAAKETLLKEFGNFFVLPFNKINPTSS